MKRKFTILVAFIALLFGAANAQVVFDPATYPVDSLQAGYTMDTIDGEVYLQVILDGWSTSFPIYDEVIVAPGHSLLKATAKYAVGTSGEHIDTINTFIQVMNASWGEKVAAAGASSAVFKEYTKDGLADGAVIGRIQLAGQERKTWGAVAGDTLWLGKVTAEIPGAFIDPVFIPADSLPTDWTFDTIDGEIYFRILLNGWSSYWEFHKDIGSYLVPDGVKAFTTIAKYSEGSSGFTVDNINTFVKFSDPSWTEIAARGVGSDSVWFNHSQSIADSTILGVLQVAGQERTGWSAVTGDTLWLSAIKALYIDSLVISSEGGVDTIDVNKDTLQLTGQVYPMHYPKGGVTWSISDTLIATVDQTGEVIAMGNGTVIVTAVANDDPSFTATFEIALLNQVLWIESITISSEGDAVTIDTQGGTLQFSAVISPEDVEDTTFTWTVTPEGFATIDTNGLLTASADGAVTVTAVANDMGAVVSNAIEVTISNQVPVTSIAVIGAGSATEITDLGGTLLMFAAVLPENASVKEVAWSVDDEAIATISAGGILTAVANGDVVVTATATDGSGVFGTVTITISGQGDNVEDVADNTLVVFPNPVMNTLYIENASAISSLEILNMNGKLIMQVLNNSNRMAIDVSGLSNGMYIIRAYQDEQIHTIKLVK
ncbi:MAG: Ig-like domain-containing protein [Bacteroidales bacterium]|nr:Ig-like domain-containing protein [Bacteroidales bacterium]